MLLVATYGIPVGLLLSPSPMVVLFFCALSVVTAHVTKSVLLFWQLPIVGVSAVTLLVLILGRLWPNYSINGEFLLIIFALVWISACYLLRENKATSMEGWMALPLAVMSLLFSMYAVIQPWSPIQGFLKIVQFGEDNGSWLNNIAHSITTNGSELTSQSGVSGGSLLGVISALSAFVIRAVQRGSENFDPAGLVLWRLYLFLMLLSCASALSIFLKQTNSKKTSFNLGLGSLVAIVSISFSSSIMGPGYLTALIAVAWLSSTLAFLLIADVESRRLKYFVATAAAINLAVIGEAWFPMYLITSLVLALLICERAVNIVKFRKFDFQFERLVIKNNKLGVVAIAVTSALLTFIGYLLLSQFMNSVFFSYISSPSRLKSLIGTGGNVGLANPLLTTALIVVAGLATLQTTNQKMMHSFNRVVFSAILGGASVIGLSLMTPPNYEIRYGASKFYVIVAATLAPAAFAKVGQWLQSKYQATNQMIATLVVLCLLFAMQMGSPIGSMAMFSRPDSKPAWFDSVIAAKLRYPERIPLCLNTDRGVGRSESAYVCSRLSIGLAGGDRSTFSQALYTFQWGNICTISADQAYAAWSDDFFKKISVVVTNKNRLSAENDCHSLELTKTSISPYGKLDGFDVWPIGWLSSVKWGLVEVVDMQGDSVSPNFNYLVDDTDDPDPINASKLAKALLSGP